MKHLIVLLLVIVAVQTQAQTIDSFHVDRTITPHELFVRMRFPDSSYYIEHTFDRVAMIYPPVNMVSFFYRSCDFVKNNPVVDTVILLYTPEPYGLRVFLANDTNRVTEGCQFFDQMKGVDSAVYQSPEGTSIYTLSAAHSQLQVFPNPATSILNVVGATDGDLYIFDALGRQQRRHRSRSEHTLLDISGLTPGVYYMHYYCDGSLQQSVCFSKLP